MKHQFVIACMITLLLSGCAQPESQTAESTEQGTPAVVEEVEESTELEQEKAEAQPDGIEVTDRYMFDRFVIDLEDQWMELNKTQEETIGIWNLAAPNGIMLQLSVMVDEDKVVDGTTIQKEVELDSYLDLIESTEVELGNGTPFYGAFIEDHATGMQFCYYLTKVDQQVVALIFSKKDAFIEEDIQWMHAVLETFEITE